MFRLNSQVRVQSGTAAETSRVYDTEDQECNEDRFPDDRHPEVGTSINRSLHSLSLEPGVVNQSFVLVESAFNALISSRSQSSEIKAVQETKLFQNEQSTSSAKPVEMRSKILAYDTVVTSY